MTNAIFPCPLPEQNLSRQTIANYLRADETQCVETLLEQAELPAASVVAIQQRARNLVTSIREQSAKKGGIDAFMHEYSLSSEEGVALMCLAEALLRVPDINTANKLISDKLSLADWETHLGNSESSLTNMASWSLMLTGKILGQEESKSYFNGVLKRFIKKTSTPVIRSAIGAAMKMLGRRFVLGNTIEDALKNSVQPAKLGYRFSYDMLGEAARTEADAEHYFQAYLHAIEMVGKTANQQGIINGPGISVKLSALHPRYEFAQRQRCLPVLIERLRSLALRAKHFDIGLTVDAEEADRLDLSLEIIEAVAIDPALAEWHGLGLALQAYQKSAFYVIDWLIEFAKQHQRRWMVRLVKGAYWDYEIKDSQIKGLANYPVFTRKLATDVSYLACAKKLLANSAVFYPQFATHNAYTVAAILAMAGTNRDFEFQYLQGMGRDLYDQIINDKELAIVCRVYAPIGHHQDLLPYLVRRLLENGASSSFINRIVDKKISIDELIADPVAKLKSFSVKPHPQIPLPSGIYLDRKNSLGIDLCNRQQLALLADSLQQVCQQAGQMAPALNTAEITDKHAVVSPANNAHKLGEVSYATAAEVDKALTVAVAAAPAWDATPVEQRAEILERIADIYEEQRAELIAILVYEAGKTLADAVGEVREAIDFCRYYAQVARQQLMPKMLTGVTGESNQLQMHGRGVVLCISPWNFPLAIFAGQIVAALVAGNCVLAKPAEQTSLIAIKAIRLMHQAGVPEQVLQVLPGLGEVVGTAAVKDLRVNGVMFTGSTEVARLINQTLANRAGAIVPFIAETGGQNALIADSTALAEQLVMDVIVSAFGSAGQRCSALRVLFVQDDIAERVITLLKGAMAELTLGDPIWLASDIGPVIDAQASDNLTKHVAYLRQVGQLIYQVPLNRLTDGGTYFAPCAFEIASLDLLQQEVFGPVLHVIRYDSKDLDKIIETINHTGYGLTLGIQTRIEATANYIQNKVKVGNIYINRNMIGAVVGAQPFGGEGLSGTGPKAGGPHYLMRLCNERVVTINTTAAAGNTALMTLAEN